MGMSEATAPTAIAARRRPQAISLDRLCLLLLAAVAILILYPIGTMVVHAFITDAGEAGGLRELLYSDLPQVLLDTTLVVTLSGTIALAVGAGLAWLNERTDARVGWVGDVLPLVPLLVPQIAAVAGWVMLLAPQAGLLNGLLRDLFLQFGMPMRRGPINVYSFGGLVAVMALYLVPYVYLTIGAALQSLDPSLEEASRMSRAGAFTTLRRVTLPAIQPALAASVLILIMLGFAIFSVPAVIGTGAHIDLLSVRIYRLVASYPARMDLAILLGIFLTVIVQAALLLQVRIAGSRRAATIGGRGLRAGVTRLGRWRWVARVALVAYVLASAVLPLLALALVSLQPFWTPRIAWDRVGLQNYVAVLVDNAITRSALGNSILLGLVGATIGMLIAAMLALAAQRRGGLFGRMAEGITALPAGVPHVVLAVGFILCFSGSGINLSGTLTVLLMIYLVMNMPQAMRAATAAVGQVGRELVEASQIFRATPARTFRRILLPLMLPSLAAGWVILFVQMSGELTASALLAGASNPVVGQVILDLWQNGSFPQIAALALTITVINAAIVLVALRAARGRRR